MKRLSYIAAACIALAACNKTDTELPSLDVTPGQLSFAAEGAAAQELTVTASGVTWEYALSAGASEWVTVEERTAGKLNVTVRDNLKSEPRTASLTVKTDNFKVKSRMVTITQQGSDRPQTYSLSVNPAALTFGAEDDRPQEVIVTVEGNDLTWSTDIAESGRSWLTVTESDGKFSVTASPNPEPARRTADITVTPSDAAVPAKAVRVTQEAKELLPSLNVTLTNGATPSEGLSFDYIGQESYRIDVEAVNCEWFMKTEYDTETTGWIAASENEGMNSISVSVGRNEEAEARTARIDLTPDADGVGPVEVKVSQAGKPDYISTLTEHVEFGTLTESYVLVRPNNDFRDQPYTDWELRLWSEGLSFDGAAYTGSGDRLNILLYTEPIAANDDNEYRIPDGTYTVTVNFGNYPDLTPQAGDISGGAFGYYGHPTFPNGTWYVRMAGSEYTGEACIRTGTMTVSSTEESYDMQFDFVSDAGYTVKGTFRGTLKVYPQG